MWKSPNVQGDSSNDLHNQASKRKVYNFSVHLLFNHNHDQNEQKRHKQKTRWFKSLPKEWFHWLLGSHLSNQTIWFRGETWLKITIPKKGAQLKTQIDGRVVVVFQTIQVPSSFANSRRLATCEAGKRLRKAVISKKVTLGSFGFLLFFFLKPLISNSENMGLKIFGHINSWFSQHILQVIMALEIRFPRKNSKHIHQGDLCF